MTSGQFIQRLSILYFALCLGPVVFGAVVYYLRSSGIVPADLGDDAAMLTMLFPMISFILMLASKYIPKKMLSGIPDETPLSVKLNSYQTHFLMKMAMLEGSAFLVLMGFLLTGNLLFMGIAGLALMLQVTSKPTPDKVIIELGLTEQHRDILEDPSQIITKTTTTE